MTLAYDLSDINQAWIDTDPRGGPVRLIINGRHRKPTGRWHSHKNRRSMPWEAKGEREQMELLEADAEVRSYLAQPHRLTMLDEGGRRLVYYPDLRVDRVGGRTEIIEIRRENPEGREDPDYDRKLRRAASVYESLGWRFRDLTRKMVRAHPGFAVAHEICLDGGVDVPPHLLVTVLRAFDAHPTLPLGRVVDALGGGTAGRARLHALTVRRVLALRLDAVLHHASPVGLAPERDVPTRVA